MKEKNNRTKWLHLRLKQDEYKKIHDQFSKSTCRQISEYARTHLLNKPVVSTYRNQSLDDFMAEMKVLRKALAGIGSNVNQAVKKLHTVKQISEFRQWIILYELEKQTLFNKVDEIKNHINKIADQWLR